MQTSFLLEHSTHASSEGCCHARARQQPHKGMVRNDGGGGRWAALFHMTEPAMLLVTSLLDTQQSPVGVQRCIEQAFDREPPAAACGPCCSTREPAEGHSWRVAKLKSHGSSGSRSRSTAHATLSLPARGAGAWQRGLLSRHTGLFFQSILPLVKPPLRFLCVCGAVLQTDSEKCVERV